MGVVVLHQRLRGRSRLLYVLVDDLPAYPSPDIPGSVVPGENGRGILEILGSRQLIRGIKMLALDDCFPDCSFVVLAPVVGLFGVSH